MSMKVYLGGYLLPVAPENIKRKIKNGNKTVKLVNGQQVNIILPPGLTEITLSDVLLPNTFYDFAEGLSKIKKSDDGYEAKHLKKQGQHMSASYYLTRLQKMKNKKKPVTLVINESSDGLCNDGPATDIEVTVEDYTITQKTEEGTNIVVDIKLLQYVPYGLETYENVSDNSGGTVTKKKTKSDRTQKETEQQTYTVVKGDTLWAIAKKFYGDGNLYHYLADLNNLKNPNILQIGQVLKIGPTSEAKAYKSTSGSSAGSSSGSSSSASSSSSESSSSGSKKVVNKVTESIRLGYSNLPSMEEIDKLYEEKSIEAAAGTQSDTPLINDVTESIRRGYSKLPSIEDIKKQAKLPQ